MKTPHEILNEEIGDRKMVELAENGLLMKVKWAMIRYKDQFINEKKNADSCFENKGDPECNLCNGAGEYHTGGSFGGPIMTHQCTCVSVKAIEKRRSMANENSLNGRCTI